MSFVALIPARWASSRFPGKPLAELAGRPMVVHVCERARASGARAVHVATDDTRILDAVRAHGHSALITRADHPSGTDRLAEAAAQLALATDEVVVNVQGDEPLVEPALIAAVAQLLAARPEAAMATAAHPLADAAQLASPNTVKVVLDRDGCALYFSRAPIPHAREPGGAAPLRHIGLYACRAGFLARYAALAPSPLERAESLEQLRALWHGERIAVTLWPHASPPGVDTPADLEAVRESLSR